MEVVQDIDIETFVEHIIEGIEEKKGKEIVTINISKLQNTVCQYFIVCHGDSTTQVNAIAQSVEFTMEERANEKVWKKQGFENCQWVVLDYVDVVVHIFLKEAREYYNLEGLWADGKLTTINNEYM
jgi:ribosome-associated protein